MEITYTHVAGLDVHKKTVVACLFIPGPTGKPLKESRTFGTLTRDLLALADWVTSKGVTQVAMASTGEYWKPVYTLLAGSFTVLVVNAQQIKPAPGRKTDVKDAAWIADLLRHGLLQGSGIPPLPQRDLRDLPRQRTNRVQDRARVVNQLQKVLEWGNINLASVASDIMGVSARLMLAELVGGEVDQGVLAELAKGRLRAKRTELERALEGHVRPHHRFMLAQHLRHIDFLEEQLAAFEAQIAVAIEAQGPPEPPASVPPSSEDEGAVREASPSPAVPSTVEAGGAVPWEEAVALVDTAPGFGRTLAEIVIAESGAAMSQFPRAGHLARWAKVCPGNRESAGKRLSSATGKGSRWLRTALMPAAHAAVKVKESQLGVVDRRLAVRRGKQRALLAVAHRLLVALYHMRKARAPYRERGIAPPSEPAKRNLADRLQRKIEQLGYTGTLQLPASVPV